MSWIMNKMESFDLQNSYLEWLHSIKGKRAKDLNLKKCQKCGLCCATRPCIPTVKELNKIAEYLKMDVSKLIKKHFVADRRYDNMFIYPAKETQLNITGTFVSWRRSYDMGYCNFYDKENKKCKIYPVRPKTARLMKCWDKEANEDNGIIDKAIQKAEKSWENIDLIKYSIDEDSIYENDENNDDW